MRCSAQCLRWSLLAYNIIAMAFFFIKTIAMFVNMSLSLTESLLVVFFLSLHGYGLLGFSMLKESLIRIFHTLIIPALLIDVFYALNLIQAILTEIPQPDNTEDTTSLFVTLHSIILTGQGIYAITTAFALQGTRALLIDIRLSRDIEHHTSQLQMEILKDHCSVSDYDYSDNEFEEELKIRDSKRKQNKQNKQELSVVYEEDIDGLTSKMSEHSKHAQLTENP